MEMSAAEQQEIRITMEEAKEAIENMKLANELMGSKPFEKIIGKMYYEDEGMRLIGLTGELSLTELQSKNVDKMIHGIAFLQRFLRQIVQLGQQMEVDLAQAEEELNRNDEETN